MHYILIENPVFGLAICVFTPSFIVRRLGKLLFKDYNIFAGANPIDAIAKSPWVGFAYFKRLFGSKDFFIVLRNTLVINGLKIIVLFPIPIICAILLNEIRSLTYRKLMQTAIYVPYFFSWVVIFGIFYSIFGSYGVVNQAIQVLGGQKVGFFTDNHVFRWVLVFTEGWKETGYNAIIYLAAITGIDPGLYEAAKVDGANKWQQVWHVTLPGLIPTIVLMLIMKVGHILDAGFEQVLVFYNPAVYESGDIIQTYVYRLGLGKMDFSLSTALGLFDSIVAFILIVGANELCKRLVHRSMW